MGHLKSLLVLLLALSSAQSFSANKAVIRERIVPPTQTATSSVTYLTDLRKRLQDQEKSVGKLTGNIIQLEKEIGKGNERYMKVLQKRRDVENGLFDIKQTLKKYEQELTIKQQKISKLLAVAVMSSLDKNDDPAVLLSRKIATDALQKDLHEIKGLWERNKELGAQMEEFKVRYEEYLTVETELASVLNNLESQKKEVQDSYDEELERKKALKQKVDHLSTVVKATPKTKETPNNVSKVKELPVAQAQIQVKPEVSSAPLDVKGIFSSPLKVTEQLEPQKRGGVYFRFKGSQPILATRDGRIIYCGDLSTYGNVVMIDHGEETRSVILGPFALKIAQGATVKAGEVIGQTSASRPGSGKIYFEVRKKNTVQNTIKLIDQKSLSAKLKG